MSVYEDAKALIELERFDEGMAVLRPGAMGGDAESQFLMGYMYFAGAEMSWLEAKKWLKAAADQEHGAAMYYLYCGEVMSFGRDGVEPEEVRRLLIRAAELGCAEAQRDLGCKLIWGEGGWVKDEAAARVWYLKAAQQGHVEAEYDLGSMLVIGDGGECDLGAGLKWLERAAGSESGDPAAESAASFLAGLYEGGEFGVEIDKGRAEVMRGRVAELEARI